MRPLWAMTAGQRACLVGFHQARIADYVGGEDWRQSTVDALFDHE
jgi:hypothetical protein